ncbi:MAG: SCO family protein [Saprospiraceae bacterium]
MRYLLFTIITIALFACDAEIPNPKKLGYQGIPTFETQVDENGDSVQVEIPFVVPEFRFLNQDSNYVTNADFENKIYAVDFFFTKCPSICVDLTRSMLRIHDEFKDDDRVALISHSIDYLNDSVAVLKEHAVDLGVEAPKWHFVECDRDQTYAFAKHYMNTAVENEDAPGGYEHSGYLVLTDVDGHLRSYADGTSAEKVDVFIEDIKILLKEMEK